MASSQSQVRSCLARHVATFESEFEAFPALNIDWVVPWSFVAVYLECRLLSRHWRVPLCEPGTPGAR